MSLTERRAEFVYEGARIAAIAAQAPIIPEPWGDRGTPFQRQFLEVIERQMGPSRSESPEELHGSWVQAYIDMGWVYGSERDTEKKTHPDMIPYAKLGQLERDKDAVFVALCEIARQWIYDLPEVPSARTPYQSVEQETAHRCTATANGSGVQCMRPAIPGGNVCLRCQAREAGRMSDEGVSTESVDGSGASLETGQHEPPSAPVPAPSAEGQVTDPDSDPEWDKAWAIVQERVMGEGHHLCGKHGTMWTGSTPQSIATCPWCKPRTEDGPGDVDGRS